MNTRTISLGLPAALLAAGVLAACSNTARGIRGDTAQNEQKASAATADARSDADRRADEARVKGDNAAEATKNAAANAVEATKNGLEKAADATKSAAERAADATRDAAHDAGTATRNASADAERNSKSAATSTAGTLDGAQQTMEIKSALIADKTVDASGIDVDTNGNTKTVTLKGHVPTAAQKAAAGRIAKSKAPDYKVVNDLTVR